MDSGRPALPPGGRRPQLTSHLQSQRCAIITIAQLRPLSNYRLCRLRRSRRYQPPTASAITITSIRRAISSAPDGPRNSSNAGIVSAISRRVDPPPLASARPGTTTLRKSRPRQREREQRTENRGQITKDKLETTTATPKGRNKRREREWQELGKGITSRESDADTTNFYQGDEKAHHPLALLPSSFLSILLPLPHCLVFFFFFSYHISCCCCCYFSSSFSSSLPPSFLLPLYPSSKKRPQDTVAPS